MCIRDSRNSKITTVDTYDEFKEKIEEGGFILAHWDGSTETEEKIKEETKATIRCIPVSYTHLKLPTPERRSPSGMESIIIQCIVRFQY